MAQRKVIFTVERISDDETGMYRMGEIDTVVDQSITKYVETFGQYGYLEMIQFLARAMSAANIAYKDFNAKQSSEGCQVAGS